MTQTTKERTRQRTDARSAEEMMGAAPQGAETSEAASDEEINDTLADIDEILDRVENQPEPDTSPIEEPEPARNPNDLIEDGPPEPPDYDPNVPGLSVEYKNQLWDAYYAALAEYAVAYEEVYGVEYDLSEDDLSKRAGVDAECECEITLQEFINFLRGRGGR